MVEKIDSGFRSVAVEAPRARQTVDRSFGAVLARGAERVAGTVLAGTGAVASVLPGGGFVAAVAQAAGEALGGEGPGGDRWALFRAQERMQQEGLENSLRLLELQRRLQQETEAVTTISNVMKNRHELAKAAINNIR